MAAIAILYKPMLVQQDDPGNILVTRIAGATITAGQAVYDDPTTGKALVADASVGGKEQFAGITIEMDKALNQAVAIVRRGLVAGYDLSALNYGAIVYLDTAGNLATVANGSKTVPVGKVAPTSRFDPTVSKLAKVLDIFVNPTINY